MNAVHAIVHVFVLLQTYRKLDREPVGTVTIAELHTLLTAAGLMFGLPTASFEDCADRYELIRARG